MIIITPGLQEQHKALPVIFLHAGWQKADAVDTIRSAPMPIECISSMLCFGVLSLVCLQLLTPRSTRSTRDEAAATVFADPSKASLGAPVSGQGEQAASTVKRVFSTASTLLQIQRNGPSLHLLIVTVLQ